MALAYDYFITFIEMKAGGVAKKIGRRWVAQRKDPMGAQE
jgi:hypothetical protein